jgi:hypothetical protein
MGKRITAGVLGILFVFLFAPAWARDTIRIGLPEAYMLEGPGTDYGLLCKITNNETLTLLSWEGDWFRVRRNSGVIGWINRVVLSASDSARYPGGSSGRGSTGKPPAGNDSSGPSFLDSIRTGFSGGTDDSLTASAGGRGIVTVDDSGTYSSDYSAVDYMESIFVSDAEINSFIVSGGLRP